MKLNKIIQCLEKWAPPIYQESYDNSGLMVGDYESEITGCLISLDCTEKIVDEAISKNCNLIISYHPIIFNGLKKITSNSGYVQKSIINAVKNNISIYAIHTSLDNHPEGISYFLAKKIGLKNATPAQILQKILQNKWSLREEDKDMIVMYHKFGYELEGEKYQIDATMVCEGENQTYTAMAKTVGLPVAIVTLRVLNNLIDSKGVKIMGDANILNKLPVSASNLYAKNMYNFIDNMFNKEIKNFPINTYEKILIDFLESLKTN